MSMEDQHRSVQSLSVSLSCVCKSGMMIMEGFESRSFVNNNWEKQDT